MTIFDGSQSPCQNPAAAPRLRRAFAFRSSTFEASGLAGRNPKERVSETSTCICHESPVAEKNARWIPEKMGRNRETYIFCDKKNDVNWISSEFH